MGPARGDERGTTILEVMVVMGILSIVGALAYAALFSGYRVLGQADDEARGLADVKLVVQRIGRDLRSARGIDPGADATQLTIWIDTNANYEKTDDEIVTWTILPSGTSQFDVVRKRGTSPVLTSNIVGETLVDAIAFKYRPAPPGGPVAVPVTAAAAPTIQAVDVGMTYDAVPGRYAKPRNEIFSIRMRNVQ